MAINISVQYNGGLLPDIILLTQGYYQWGTRLNTMQWLCISSLCNVSPLIASKTLHRILRMYYILYFLGYSSRVRVVLRCQYVHRTRKSSDFELQVNMKYSGEPLLCFYPDIFAMPYVSSCRLTAKKTTAVCADLYTFKIEIN